MCSTGMLGEKVRNGIKQVQFWLLVLNVELELKSL